MDAFDGPKLAAFNEAGACDAPPTHVRYRVFAAGFSLAMLIYIQRQAFVRAMPDIKSDLGLDSEQMGYLASTFLIAYGIFQVPCGLLGDRLARGICSRSLCSGGPC